MDAERLGRALGRGVRAAGKTLVEVAEAAAAPSRESAQSTPRTGKNPIIARPITALASPAAALAEQPQKPMRQEPARRGSLRQGGQRFGRAVWAPAARAGGVLWYEVTGSFFALFAIAAGVEVWRHRLDLLGSTHAGTSPAAGRVWFAIAMLLVFGWFTVSSFLKARQRARR